MKLIEMLTLPVKASVIAFAVLACGFADSAMALIDNSTCWRDSSYLTGSLLDKNATTPVFMSTETRMRINTSNAGNTYDLTFPTTNFLGVLWFYAGDSTLTGAIDMSIDGTGAVFEQAPTYEGEVVNNAGVDAFVLNAFSYSTIANLAGVKSTASSVESFSFSNTVMRLQAFPNYDYFWSYDGGRVSFAGRSGSVANGGILVFPGQDRESEFRFDLDDAETYLPALIFRGNYQNARMRVNGGTLTNNGYLKFSSDKASKYAGTNLLEIVNGAKMIQKSWTDVGMKEGLTTRTERISVRGSGSEFRLGDAFKTLGHTVIEVLDGGKFVEMKDKTGINIYFGLRGDGTGLKGDSKGEMTVSGLGSVFDMRNQSSLNFYGSGSAFTAADGAEVRFPQTVNFGNSAGGDVTVNVSGADTKVYLTGVNGSGIYFPIAGGCTVNMTGGYVGRTPGDARGTYFRLGHQENSSCTFNMSGGTICLPGQSDGALDIGLSGDAAFNMSGGEIIVSNLFNLGYTANMTSPKTAVFNQTGGRVFVYYGAVVCAGSDTPYRHAEMNLEGGEFVCDQLTGGKTTIAGYQGTGIVTGDGGVLKPRQTREGAAYPFMKNIDSVRAGDRGFTFDTDQKNVRSCQQVFADKPGEKGVFVKTGLGRLSLQDIQSYGISRTVVDQGTLYFDVQSSVTLATTMCLTNSGILSIAGSGSASSLTLDGLEAAGGTILMDPTDTITVNGAADLRRLRLNLSSLPADGQAVELFVFKTPLSAESQRGLKNAYVENAVADGSHGAFAYDVETGKVSFAVVKDSDPIGPEGTVTWTGSDGVWETAGNWTPSAPTAESKAEFAENGAAKTVTVGSSAVVTALGFTGTGFTLGGTGRVALEGEQGSVEISASAGTQNEVSVPLSVGTIAGLSVAADATLTVSGPVTDGGFKKTGKGTVELSGENALSREVMAAGGILKLTGARSVKGAPALVGQADTVSLANSDLEVGHFAVRETDISQPIVIDAPTDVRLTSFNVTSGGFVKRGTGKLTLDASEATTSWTLTRTKGTGSNGRPASTGLTGFPADGTPPDKGFAGLTIAEGEVVIRGNGDSRVKAGAVQHKAPGCIVVGMGATNVDANAQAALTLDNVDIDNYNGSPGHLFVGFGTGLQGTKQRTPTLRVLNGSYLKLDTLRVGISTYGAISGCHATLAVTNSTIRGGSIYFSDSEANANPAIVRCKDSEITSYSYPTYVHGSIDAVFDHCWIGKGTLEARNETTPCQFGCYSWSYTMPTGKVEFVNGSTLHGVFINFYVDETHQLQKGMTILFDDSEWNYGNTADYTFLASTVNGFFTLATRGKGLILRPAAGTTFTTEVPFKGAGGVRNLGAGTVRFASGTAQFTGAAYAAAGATVDFTEAGTVAAGISGSGTFKGLSGAGTRIVLDAADDWTGFEVPVLDGGTLTGTVAVDFGRTAANPLSDSEPKGLVVAKLVNGTVLPKNLRLKNTGLKNKRGVFSVNADGEVVMDVVDCGMMMIVR